MNRTFLCLYTGLFKPNSSTRFCFTTCDDVSSQFEENLSPILFMNDIRRSLVRQLGIYHNLTLACLRSEGSEHLWWAGHASDSVCAYAWSPQVIPY
jgi:hypothetical protein